MQLKLDVNCSNLMTLHGVSESRAVSYIGDPDVERRIFGNCKMTNQPAEARFSVNAATAKTSDFRDTSSRYLVSTSGNTLIVEYFRT